MRAFDKVVRVRAPAVMARLTAGRPEEQIHGAFARVGIEPSDEAITWWSVYDGPTLSDVSSKQFPMEMLPNLQFLSMEASVRGYEAHRRLAKDLVSTWDGLDINDVWHRQWVPLFAPSSGGTVAVDCSQPRDQPSPLRAVYPDEVGSPEYAKVIAPSLGTLVADATRWLKYDTCRHDPDQLIWVPSEAWQNRDLTNQFKPPPN